MLPDRWVKQHVLLDIYYGILCLHPEAQVLIAAHKYTGAKT